MKINDLRMNRRVLITGASATAFLAGSGLSFARKMPLPAKPVEVKLMDVGGALSLVQPALELYAERNPDKVSRIVFLKAPVTELAGKLKVQQKSNRVDIDLVLTGSDGLAAGLVEDTWMQILPEFNETFPDIEANYEPAALNLHKIQGAGYGVVVTYYPSGPLLEYAPERVAKAPESAEELLVWAKENPGRFLYARPTNSGPARTFMMGLPYILGDKDPTDPINGWEKTWNYLAELGDYIDYYPAGTGATMKEFGEGSRDIIVTTTGWDINPRAVGIVPETAKISTLKGFHWVSDAFFMCIPKGVKEDVLAVTLDIMAFLLTPEAQAFAYNEGSLYPGPAVKNVPLSMAPQHSQDIIKQFGRPEYDDLIANNPIELPLKPEKMVQAFRKWDELVGARKS